MEKGINKNDLVSLLMRSPHAAGNTRKKKGEKVPQIPYSQKLREAYLPVASEAAKQEAAFYGHLLSWNLAKGQVKDSRVALPVIALTAGITHEHPALLENALAHMAALDPRLFVRALEFARDLKVQGRRKMLHRLVTRYLRNREANMEHWTRVMVQHRQSMSKLYFNRWIGRVPPGGTHKNDTVKSYEWNVLHGYYEPHSVFAAIANMKDIPLAAALEAIRKFDIPHLVTLPALGARAKDPDVLMELINSMSTLEIMTNMKMLEKLGARSTPALRALMDRRLSEAKGAKKGTLKTSQAAKAVAEVDEVLAEKLRQVQDEQIKSVSTIDGDWLVLADKSGSMARSIEISRYVAALLTKAVKGKVYLVFFNDEPEWMDVTGKNYQQIQEMTSLVHAGGGTSIGCGVLSALKREIRVDGITVVSDGEHGNSPAFSAAYQQYAKFLGKEPTVYFYRVPGGFDNLSDELNDAGIVVTTRDVRNDVDYHSLPNLISTQRVNQYSLIDEVMSTPLLKLDDVLGYTKGMEVMKNVERTETFAG